MMAADIPHVLKKSFRTGLPAALRVLAGASESFDVVLSEPVKAGTVLSVTVERWADLQQRSIVCDAGGAGTLIQVSVPFPEPGVYRFSFCAENEGGERTELTPHGYVIADPPQVADLRMYTLIPAVCGTIVDWTEDIDRIKDLGFNAIQLLPITTMGASLSPYSASDLLTIDPAFHESKRPEDRMDAFRAFVSRMETRHMHLCVDLVLNHVAVDGIVARKHPEWLAEDPEEPDGIRRAGWDDGTTWHTWRDLALLNYEPFREADKKALWSYMTKYALQWAGLAAQTDGIIRLDNLHSSYRPFVLHVLREIKNRFRNVAVLGELFNTERNIRFSAAEYGLSMLLGTPWEHKFVPDLRRYLRYVHKNRGILRFFFPITSHDSRSPAEEFGSPDSTVPRLAASMLMGPGPTGIVQGVEIGLKRKPEFIGLPRRLQFHVEHDFRDLIRKLCGLREAYPVFNMAGNALFVDGGHDAILSVLRLDPKTGWPRWLICANFDTHREHSIDIDFSAITNDAALYLFDVIDGGDPVSVGASSTKTRDGVIRILLSKAGIKVYRIQR
jgi:hypothetical protein